MKKYTYQTYLRMSEVLKDQMTKICKQNEINESDFMRVAIKKSILNHSRESEDGMNRLRYAQELEQEMTVFQPLRINWNMFASLFRLDPSEPLLEGSFLCL